LTKFKTVQNLCKERAIDYVFDTSLYSEQFFFLVNLIFMAEISIEKNIRYFGLINCYLAHQLTSIAILASSIISVCGQDAP